MSYGPINRGCVVIELDDDGVEVVDLTGENDEVTSNHHGVAITSDAELRTSYEHTNRGRVVIELPDDEDEETDTAGEHNEVMSVSDRATILSDVNTNTSDGGSVTSSEDTNMNDENFDISSVSDEATTTSDVDIDTSDEDSVTSSEDTDTSDEDIEDVSVSDEADTDTDATSQDSNDDDYQPDEECSQPDEEPAPMDYSASIDTTEDSWLDEWPDQSPAKIDLKVSHSKQRSTTVLARSNMRQNFRRFPQSLGEHLIPKRRHSQKFRDFKYGKASILQILVVWTQVHPSERHFWLPSAFDHPRGRPYELICERVWDSWRRERRDRAMRDAIPSIERGGERNWPNAGPAMIRFPEHRIRHKNRRRN